MEAIKFTLSGKTAFFKNPEVNTYQYLTYNHIHRVALLGLLGALMGYSGYFEKDRVDYPEFYKKLSSLKISVLPNTSIGEQNQGVFKRKLQVFNNSTAFASREEGGNLVVKQIWLEDVSWDIYILVDDEVSRSLADMILNRKAVYLPYLGSNDHPADITSQDLVKLEQVEEVSSLDSIYKTDDLKITRSTWKSFKYQEDLPYYLEKNTERHITQTMGFTNAIIEIQNKKCRVYQHQDRKMIFYDEMGAY